MDRICAVTLPWQNKVVTWGYSLGVGPGMSPRSGESKSFGNALRSGGRECHGAILRMWGCSEVSARANMFRTRREMKTSSIHPVPEARLLTINYFPSADVKASGQTGCARLHKVGCSTKSVKDASMR
ncbi:jg4924 [Pararge aegeria aegeria]|uniref:Jg4924 protein n=1 Tax=Pararge aegeria aegeria TaxID=348720 RepID=A0A8S4SJX6_9NEOP|nr:jg4924 [Pararge aegeria aegeria]